MSHVSEVSRVFPEPPFAPELIAEFHAGALDDALNAHVQAHLPEDPDAQELLAALDETVDALRTMEPPAVAVPDQVRAASETTLAGFRRGAGSAAPRRVVGLLLVAAAVLAVLAAGALAAELMSPRRSADPHSAQLVPAADTSALLAAVRAPQSEAIDANRLARCLIANRMGGAGVIGAAYIVYGGRPAQVILTPTGRPGEFNALVTTRDCDAGKPGTIARAVVTE